MSPRRLLKRRYLPFAVAGLVILFGFAFSAWAIRGRTNQVNRILRTQQELSFQACVQNEIQDAVIVSQLEAAKRRARATLPPHSAVLRLQIQTIDDGIATLEPPDEPDCIPPEGTQP